MKTSVWSGARYHRFFASCGALAGCFYFFAACGQTVAVGLDDPEPEAGQGGASGQSGAASGGVAAGAGTGPSFAGGGAASSSAGGEPTCLPTECRGRLYACGDCEDNDADGLVDALDSACLGPCDDDEEGLSTGLSNSSAACRRDCYFDGDAGVGNDRCEWSYQCDPLSVAPSYPPSGEARCAYDPKPGSVDCAAAVKEQPDQCIAACLPLVPNGCDCFGCCELPARSGRYRFVGADGSTACSLDKLDDPRACPPCTPVTGCLNECAKCEACVGSTSPEPGCEAAACGAEQRACGPDAPCEPGSYCVTGCCVLAPIR